MIQLDVCRARLNDGMLTHPEAGTGTERSMRGIAATCGGASDKAWTISHICTTQAPGRAAWTETAGFVR